MHCFIHLSLYCQDCQIFTQNHFDQHSSLFKAVLSLTIDRTLFGDRSLHVGQSIRYAFVFDDRSSLICDRSLLRFLATGVCDRSHPIGRSIAQSTWTIWPLEFDLSAEYIRCSSLGDRSHPIGRSIAHEGFSFCFAVLHQAIDRPISCDRSHISLDRIL